MSSDRPTNYLQQGNVFNDDAQQIIYGDLSQIFQKSEPPQWTGDEAPNNLRRLGIGASPIFVGRSQELQQLDDLVTRKGAVAIAGVSGMGGIGKTELAGQYARRCLAAGRFPGGVVWLAAGSVLVDLPEVARTVGAIAPDLDLSQFESAVERSRFCLNHWWHQGPVLLVLDDGDREAFQSQVVPLLGMVGEGENPKFRVVMTTRDRELVAADARLALDCLEVGAAVLLLRAKAEETVEGEPTEAELALVNWLGRLPLAVELVGRYRRLEGLDAAAMLRELEQVRIEHEGLNETDPMKPSQRGLLAAFELSWQRLDEKARTVAGILAGLAPEPAIVPWDLVLKILARLQESQGEMVSDEKDWRAARQVLVALDLLREIDQSQKHYQLHPLTVYYYRKHQSDYDQQAVALELFTAIQFTTWPLTNEQISTIRFIIPYLETLAQRQGAGLPDDKSYIPANRVAWFYEIHALEKKAEVWNLQAKKTAQARLGIDHPATTATLNNLALSYESQGKLLEAEMLYKEAININRKKLSPGNTDLAIELNNLANLYRAQDKWSESESLYQEAIAISRGAGPIAYPQLGMILGNFGELHRLRGQWSEAESLYQEALEIHEKSLPLDHPYFAAELHHLAHLYLATNRAAQALPLYQQALEILTSALPPQHPDIEIVQGSLAACEDYLISSLKIATLFSSDEVLSALCKKHKIRELSLFGSALRNDFGLRSDIDLLADFESDANHSLLDHIRIEDELQKLLGRPVDLVDKSAIKQSYNPLRRSEILSTSLLLYPRKSQSDSAITIPMSPTSRDLSYLLDILESAERIQEHNTHQTLEQFRNDRKTQDAIIYQIMIIGEVAKRLSQDCQEDYPDIPWSSIAKMRDKLIHQYAKTNLDIVWNVITLEIPNLVQALAPLRPQ